MIAYIKGTIEQVLDQAAIVENNGIGYTIMTSTSTISRLPAKGSKVQIFTFLYVKDDGLTLYGFLSAEEVRIFNLLISVSGIGPKVATSILGTLTPDQIMAAIVSEDSAAFSKVPGVGKKTAQRISLELQGKIKTESIEKRPLMANPHRQDAVDALVSLGYSSGESMRAVMETALDDMSADQIIRQALKKL